MAEHFTLVVGQPSFFEELLSTLYLVSYSFDYSSYFCPTPARRIPRFSSRTYERAPVSPSALTRALFPRLRRYILPHVPHDTYIPQLACYASRERRTFVKNCIIYYVHTPPLLSLTSRAPSPLTPPALPVRRPRPLQSILGVAHPGLSSVHGERFDCCRATARCRG